MATASALVFDLDRTLVDVQSFTDYAAALGDVESMIGTWPGVTTPDTSWDAPTRACMEVLVALAGDPRWQQVSDVIEAHEAAAAAASRPMKGLAGVLAATAGRRRAVATLLPPAVARQVLDFHGVAIETVVGRQPNLFPKPAPDQLVEAARLLGVATGELLMIGDSTWDLQAAVAAGCAFIGVRNGARSEFPPATDTVADLEELGVRLADGWADT
jgi:phosphoglycolate phosphatase